MKKINKCSSIDQNKRKLMMAFWIYEIAFKLPIVNNRLKSHLLLFRPSFNTKMNIDEHKFMLNICLY